MIPKITEVNTLLTEYSKQIILLGSILSSMANHTS